MVSADEKRIRIVFATLGLDCHDHGIRFISASLRNAGMEVIYIGKNHTPDAAAKVAVQEDADVLGISFHNGDHLVMVPALLAALRREEAHEISVVIGGLIPDEDIPVLTGQGVKGVFLNNSSTESIVNFIRDLVRKGEPTPAR